MKDLSKLHQSDQEKKAWMRPELVNYGDVADITRQIKSKSLGSSDDFQINGIQDPGGIQDPS